MAAGPCRIFLIFDGVIAATGINQVRTGTAIDRIIAKATPDGVITTVTTQSFTTTMMFDAYEDDPEEAAALLDELHRDAEEEGAEGAVHPSGTCGGPSAGATKRELPKTTIVSSHGGPLPARKPPGTAPAATPITLPAARAARAGGRPALVPRREIKE